MQTIYCEKLGEEIFKSLGCNKLSNSYFCPISSLVYKFGASGCFYVSNFCLVNIDRKVGKNGRKFWPDLINFCCSIVNG